MPRHIRRHVDDHVKEWLRRGAYEHLEAPDLDEILADTRALTRTQRAAEGTFAGLARFTNHKNK